MDNKMMDKKIPPAFEAATNTLPHRPPDAGAFWSAWRRNARQRNVRRAVLDTMIAAYPGYVEIHLFGGIAAVVSDRFIREFIPAALLQEPLDPKAIKLWLDSSAGYVADPIPWSKAATG